MIQEFNFQWNGKRCDGYFNAIAHETVIVHFEDATIQESLGFSLIYSKPAEGDALTSKAYTERDKEIYETVTRAVERSLGVPLRQYLQ